MGQLIGAPRSHFWPSAPSTPKKGYIIHKCRTFTWRRMLLPGVNGRTGSDPFFILQCLSYTPSVYTQLPLLKILDHVTMSTTSHSASFLFTVIETVVARWASLVSLCVEVLPVILCLDSRTSWRQDSQPQVCDNACQYRELLWKQTSKKEITERK